MRLLFSAELSKLKAASPEGPRPEDLLHMLVGDLGIFLAYWYGALYVVIEGYREL
jgi:hypothetical protein